MRSTVMKYLLATVAYVGTLLVVGVAAMAIVLVLAGPHSDLLPQPLQIVVFAIGWIAVLVLPALAARAAWRRAGAKRGA